MLRRASTYNELRTGFKWSIPARYNIGTDVCDRHVSGNPLALIYLSEGAGARRFGFDDVRRWSNRFANALAALGLDRGDRIGVLLPQAPETAVAHLTGFRSGLVTVPLFSLFGPEALAFRLRNSGARAVVTDAWGAEKIDGIRSDLPDLQHVFTIDGPGPVVANGMLYVTAGNAGFVGTPGNVLLAFSLE